METQTQQEGSWQMLVRLNGYGDLKEETIRRRIYKLPGKHRSLLAYFGQYAFWNEMRWHVLGCVFTLPPNTAHLSKAKVLTDNGLTEEELDAILQKLRCEKIVSAVEIYGSVVVTLYARIPYQIIQDAEDIANVRTL